MSVHEEPHHARRIFESWAPPGHRWSPWAKPVLFTYRVERPVDEVPAWRHDVRHLPAADGRCAAVVDLPGLDGLSCGLALAARGFAPIPLYNVTKGPGEEVIDLEPLIAGLAHAAGVLARTPPRQDSPPAFLIDSRRRSGAATPSKFDNRWMVFPQDFPSARALSAAGVERVALLSAATSASPGPDLRATLRLWRREGLAIEQIDVTTGSAFSLDFATSLLAVFGDHLAAIFHGLRENSAGGFGGVVPMPQSTSGGFA